MGDITLRDATVDTVAEFAMCGYKNVKQEGYRRKLAWLRERFAEGMVYKALWSEDEGAVGAIEYVPAEHAWRPVEAPGYMFIHCICILPKAYKGQGYGHWMLEACEQDAREKGMNGLAVITRKGTFMAGPDLFLQSGFQRVDVAPPDFQLLAKRFREDAPLPSFSDDWETLLSRYSTGLHIFTSDQCPYVEKSVREISALAKEEYGLKPQIVELKNAAEVRECPCAFGSFCIVYNGVVIADHPISSRRFSNIMTALQE